MSSEVTPNKCQYWSTDENGNPTEPASCSHWDSTIPMCTYIGDAGEYSEFYPWCNLLGTKTNCKQYDGGEGDLQSICTLPDPYRRAVKPSRFSGKEWVNLPTIGADGDITEAGDFDNISGYNDGQCDGAGTNGECSGYSPYHLGFSSIQPDDKDGTLEYDEDGVTTGSGLSFRLPLNYKIFNVRAELSKCYWWNGDIEEFSVNTNDGSIEDINFLCNHPDTGYTQRFNSPDYRTEYATYRAPCNGCKPECQYYTGVCWQYCIDEKMKQGDKVLAEQMLELRWHLRKNDWKAQKFIESFEDPIIYAWKGTLLTDGNNYSIDAIKTEIIDYEDFTLQKSTLRLTEGTPDNKLSKNYPTLLREIKDIPLRPIVRNKFFELDEEYVFESGSLSDDTVLLFGDSFYDSTVYAINLSDPELSFLANELRFVDYPQVSGDVNEGTAEFDIKETWCECMDDVRARYKTTEDFEDKFYTKFETIIERLQKYWPEKITATELGSSNYMFYVDTPVVWGENKIMLLDKGSGTWDFTLFKFNRYFCGGLPAQTSYVLEGDSGKTIDYLPAYERDFCAYTNNNGSITFKFIPYTNVKGKSSEVSHVYNDYFTEVIAANPLNLPSYDTYETGYQLYKVNLELEDDQITFDNIRFFGNAGYAMVEIPDTNNKLSSVSKDWEIDGSFYLYVTTINGEEKIVKMSVYEKCTSRLETNQMIIRPSNIQDFTAPCDAVLEFDGGIYYYEKRSFGEVPDDDYEVVDEISLADDDVVNYRDSVELTDVGLGEYELTKFGVDTLLISIVYRGSITGKIKGVTRTKMLTWVRQPFCRDVEINYSWRSDYEVMYLEPAYMLYGRTYYRYDDDLQTLVYYPDCGDHDLGYYNTKGPMWYPYDACAEFSTYDTSQLTSRVAGTYNRIMEVFEETGEDGSASHGYWDTRMLGPSEWYGDIYDVKASIFACRTDWSYYNKHKVTENIFNGYGRYRCGLDYESKELCTRNGGTLPKFGNPYRDFLRSYLSTDCVYYYVAQDDSYIRRKKWMPSHHFYTKANVFDGASANGFDLYTLDTTSPYINPVGLFLNRGTFEGEDINELIELDYDGDPIRYRFDDVFRTHLTTTAIRYPYPYTLYTRGLEGTPQMSWYTFHDYGISSVNSIQWIWQEDWSPLMRSTPSTGMLIGEDIMSCDTSSIGDTTGDIEVEDADNGIDEFLISLPYDYNDGDLSGFFNFCNISYPDYMYDVYMKEHRLMMDEGNYTLYFTAPTREDDGSYDDKKFYLQLGDGPERSFDIDGNWDPDSDNNPYYTLYTTCTQDPWVTNVTLFGYGYTNTSTTVAESEDRMILTYDDAGDEVKTYYQRGLNVSLNTSNFKYLPRQKTLMISEQRDLTMSKVPDFIPDEESVYNNIEAGESFDMEEACIECGFNCSNESVDFIFDFNDKKAVDRIVFICKFGSEEIEWNDDGDATKWRFYHIPAVEISHSDLGLIYTDVWSDSSMTLSSMNDDVEDKNVIINYNLSGSDVLDTHNKWRVRLRLQPTASEISNTSNLVGHYTGNEHIVYFKCIYIYDTKFVDATDNIEIFERKYNISYGRHGDFPPHGFDSTGSLLYPPLSEFSSLYQRDTIDGVVGMSGSSGELTSINKFRGRIMKETHEDKEELVNKELSKMEEEQKKIHDEIAIDKGQTSFTLTSVIPPGLLDKLTSANAYLTENWSCDFINTVILPLSPVEPQSSYSPCGEYWDWDFSDYGWHRDLCPTHEVFEYSYFSACDDSVIGSPIDALTLYGRGSVASYLVNPMAYVLPSAGLAIATYVSVPVSNYSYPSAVDPY